MNNYIRYIRKDIECILIPNEREKCNRYNPRHWRIATGLVSWGNAMLNFRRDPFLNFADTIEKKFFVFVYVGDDFPIMYKYKEILLILQKYKYSKVYTSTNGYIRCYYLKRGVVFHNEFCDNNNKDKKFQALNRLFKLLKLKTKQL